MTNNKTEQLSLRMSSNAKSLLRIAANKEHRSASNMVEHLVLDYCVKHGITETDDLTKQEQPATKD